MTVFFLGCRIQIEFPSHFLVLLLLICSILQNIVIIPSPRNESVVGDNFQFNIIDHKWPFVITPRYFFSLSSPATASNFRKPSSSDTDLKKDPLNDTDSHPKSRMRVKRTLSVLAKRHGNQVLMPQNGLTSSQATSLISSDKHLIRRGKDDQRRSGKISGKIAVRKSRVNLSISVWPNDDPPM